MNFRNVYFQYTGGINLIEKFSSECSEKEATDFEACLEAYLFQGLSGHMLMQLSVSEMGWIEKRKYIKNEISRFLSMKMFPKNCWFNNGKEVMMYWIMKLHMWDALIVLGNIYHIKQKK